MFCRVLLDNLIRLVLEERWRGEHAGTIPARLARDAQMIGWKTRDITFISKHLDIKLLGQEGFSFISDSQTSERQTLLFSETTDSFITPFVIKVLFSVARSLYLGPGRQNKPCYFYAACSRHSILLMVNWPAGCWPRIENLDKKDKI